MQVTYSSLLKTFKQMRLDGVPMNECEDALELDSDQDVEISDVRKAIEDAYLKQS